MWVCPACGGRAVSVRELRRTHDRAAINQVWNDFRDGLSGAGRNCPLCDDAMGETSTHGTAGTLTLDVCLRCQFLWFDASEFDLLSRPATPAAPAELPEAARLLIAEVELERLQRKAEEGLPGELPESTWKLLLSFLFPVELGTARIVRTPWVTWTLALSMVAMTVAVYVFPDSGRRLAWVPTETFDRGGLTLLTGFLLHGGLLHLIGNLYFLLVFGDDVESLIGPLRYIGLLAAAQAAAVAGHLLITPDLDRGVVGSSGAISAIIVFYAVRFPNRQIGMWILHGYAMIRGSGTAWWTAPVGFLVFAWAVFQTGLALVIWHGYPIDVSAGAHLGGAAVGLYFGWRSRRSARAVSRFGTLDPSGVRHRSESSIRR